MGDEDDVHGVVADGQVDEQRTGPPVSAAPDAEGVSGVAPRRKTAVVEQGETQHLQVLVANLHLATGLLVDFPVGRLAANEPDGTNHLCHGLLEAGRYGGHGPEGRGTVPVNHLLSNPLSKA